MGKKFAVPLMVTVEEQDGVPAEHGLTLDEIGAALAWYTKGLNFQEEIEVPAEDGSGDNVMKMIEFDIDSVSYGKVVEIVDPSDRLKRPRPRRRLRASLATVPPVPGRSSEA